MADVESCFKIATATERKERKKSEVLLCDLCVLLRLTTRDRFVISEHQWPLVVKKIPVLFENNGMISRTIV
jgi:hypothetical protein